MTSSMTLAETALVSHANPAKTRPLRRNRVTTVLVAAVVSLAMIVASALPARADRNNDDLLKAIAAIAAIALISKAVKDNKRRHAPAPPAPVQVPRVPGVCAIEIGSGYGSVTGYGERCLREEGFNYRLPEDCATSIRIYGRADRFFPEQCLRDAGFTIGAH